MEQKEFLPELKEINLQMQDALVDYLQDGFVSSLAKITAFLDEEHRSKALEKFPQEIKTKVMERMEGLKKDEAGVLSEVAQASKKAGFNVDNKTKELTHRLSYERKKAIQAQLEDFDSENPLLAMRIDNSFFMFEDIVYLDDRAIQKVLRETEASEIAKALKGADPEVQDKIFRNMSRRAGAMLREDMEFMGPVLESDVFDAQKEIVNIIKRLEDSGEIVVARFGDENFYV